MTPAPGALAHGTDCALGVTIGTGGAITILSDAEAEYDEMVLKAFNLWKVFQDF